MLIQLHVYMFYFNIKDKYVYYGGEIMKKKSISLIIAMTIFMGIAPISQKGIAYEAEFSEDFESGSDAWTTNKGTWGIVNDDSKAFTNTESKKDGLVSRGDVNWRDYTVEGKVKATKI